jgi:hypothetical protein
MGKSDGTSQDGRLPNHCTNFLQANTIQGCIQDTNFEEKMESISPTHLKRAKLIKEHITQQENDNC